MSKGTKPEINSKNNSRHRPAVNQPENHFEGGHWIKTTDIFVGVGKNRRRKRLDCAFCPYSDEDGRKLNRQCTTLCPGCEAPLHKECLVAYHIQNGFRWTSNVEADSRKRPRKSISILKN